MISLLFWNVRHLNTTHRDRFSLCYILYQHSAAAVTNYHKLSGLKQHNVWFSCWSEAWHWSRWAKIRRAAFLLEVQGWICFLLLCSLARGPHPSSKPETVGWVLPTLHHSDLLFLLPLPLLRTLWFFSRTMWFYQAYPDNLEQSPHLKTLNLITFYVPFCHIK